MNAYLLGPLVELASDLDQVIASHVACQQRVTEIVI
jgi:hypothetical protein